MKRHLASALIMVLLTGGMIALAQETPPKGDAKKAKAPPEKAKAAPETAPKSKGLPELIDQALKHHPDLRVASSKIRIAEAKLQEAKDEYAREQHRIAAAVTEIHGKVRLGRQQLETAKARLGMFEALFKDKLNSPLDIQTERATFARLQAEVEADEARLESLTSEFSAHKPPVHPDLPISQLQSNPMYPFTVTVPERGTPSLERLASVHAHPLVATPAQLQNCQACHAAPNDVLGFAVSRTTPSMHDRIRKVLDTPLKLDANGVLNLEQFIELLQSASGVDIPFRILVKADQGEVTLTKSQLPIGAWLQAAEDSLPQVRFVVREYGILITSRDRVPEGAVYLQAFWKHAESPVKEPTKK